MSEKFKKCPACRGRGHFHCACWPGDCICPEGNRDCEVCDATGLIHPEDYDDLFITLPTKEQDNA